MSTQHKSLHTFCTEKQCMFTINSKAINSNLLQNVSLIIGHRCCCESKNLMNFLIVMLTHTHHFKCKQFQLMPENKIITRVIVLLFYYLVVKISYAIPSMLIYTLNLGSIIYKVFSKQVPIYISCF